MTFLVERLAEHAAEGLLGVTDLFIIEVALFEFTGRPLANEVIAFMKSRGYFIYDVAGFIRRPLDGNLALMDICFVRADAPFRGPRSAW